MLIRARIYAGFYVRKYFHILFNCVIMMVPWCIHAGGVPVSYTHLDVYKRQAYERPYK